MKINIGLLRVGLLFCGFLTEWCLCMKDLKIQVPAAVERGHDATLNCMFDLDGDRLYSVKWYRGSGEFYRYTPSESPKVKQFKIKGLNVRGSDNAQVVLLNVTRDVSGMFSCEVTAEQPSFFTDVGSAHLEVVDLPKGGPRIEGLMSRYRINDTLKANCISEGSSPGVNLTWYINDNPVDSKFVHKHKPRPFDRDLVSTHSTLRLTVKSHLFHKAKIRIRCVASLYNLYHMITEKIVGKDKKSNRNSHHHHTTTSTTMVPYKSWELTQAAKRPPDTWVFVPMANDFLNHSIRTSPLSILGHLAILLINVIMFER
ncbi:uncharacterized protein LOC109597975 [Aethina tumida]|uniref:uncharacterized protein LOC109597975 n=1 Tax=Aethina tumida TaxID=116153 RepID=UPI0021491BF5|nr:uncharacterized protein LOC109597975 [Aethina tumida]